VPTNWIAWEAMQRQMSVATSCVPARRQSNGPITAGASAITRSTTTRGAASRLASLANRRPGNAAPNSARAAASTD
jgi:hypothetical protein